MQKQRAIDGRKLLLMLVCLAVNLVGSRLALHFELPLFLDSIGTVVSAALGGYLSGIIVGFCTNIVNCASDPVTIYYGILSVVIGCFAAYASYHGAFRSLGGTLLAGLSFALVGGVAGSLLTWLLYGFTFGEGVSAPLAHFFFERGGFSEFFSQLTADVLIDVADKLITVLVVFALFRLLSGSFIRKFPLGENCRPATAARRLRSESSSIESFRSATRL